MREAGAELVSSQEGIGTSGFVAGGFWGLGAVVFGFLGLSSYLRSPL